MTGKDRAYFPVLFVSFCSCIDNDTLSAHNRMNIGKKHGKSHARLIQETRAAPAS